MAEIVWKNIIGEKTADNGGYVGDLLELALVHLQKARDNNQLSESRVGEVYAGTINAAIGQGIQYEMTKIAQEATATQAVAQADKAVAEAAVVKEDIYKQNRINVLIAEEKAATAQANKAEIDSFIADELLISEKEKNGFVGYNYIFKFKYYDYANLKHNIDPTYTVDSEGNKVYAPMPGSVEATVVLYVYKNGIGEWVEVQSETTEYVPTTVEHLSFTASDGSKYNTRVSTRDNKSLIGDAYIIKDSTGHNIVVAKGDDSTDIPNIAVSGVMTDSTTALQWSEGVVGSYKNHTEWNTMYADYIDNPNKDEYSNVVYFKHYVVYSDNTNINNYSTNVATEIGWDGVADNPDNKPNTKHLFTYNVSVDETEIFEATRVTDGTGEDRLDSLVKLQKLEIKSTTEREEKKVSLSRLPSGR